MEDLSNVQENRGVDVGQSEKEIAAGGNDIIGGYCRLEIMPQL